MPLLRGGMSRTDISKLFTAGGIPSGTLLQKIKQPGYVPTPRVNNNPLSGTLAASQPSTPAAPAPNMPFHEWLARNRPGYNEGAAGQTSLPDSAVYARLVASKSPYVAGTAAATPATPATPAAPATPPPAAATPALDALSALTNRLKGIQPVGDPQPVGAQSTAARSANPAFTVGMTDAQKAAADPTNPRWQPYDGRVSQGSADFWAQHDAAGSNPVNQRPGYASNPGTGAQVGQQTGRQAQDTLLANRDAAGRVAPPSAVLMRDEDQIRKAQRQARIKMRSRKGRASTILSRDRL